jgi:hypothetical protein
VTDQRTGSDQPGGRCDFVIRDAQQDGICAGGIGSASQRAANGVLLTGPFSFEGGGERGTDTALADDRQARTGRIVR